MSKKKKKSRTEPLPELSTGGILQNTLLVWADLSLKEKFELPLRKKRKPSYRPARLRKEWAPETG